MKERQELFDRVAMFKESEIDYFLNLMAYSCAVWIRLTEGETLHPEESWQGSLHVACVATQQ
jgi:hypothetical protein